MAGPWPALTPNPHWGSSFALNSDVTVDAGATSTISAAVNWYGTPATRTFNVAGTLNVTGALMGAAGISADFNLIKAGSGTMTLSGTNGYTGTTTVTGGILSISSDANLGADPSSATPGNIVLNGGTLQATATFTLNSKRGIALGPTSGSGTGTFDVANGDTLTYGGILANNGGTGNLTTTDSGTVSLSGNSTYTGATTVNAGTLAVGGNIADTDGLTVALSATVQITNGSPDGITVTNNTTPQVTDNGTIDIGVGSNYGFLFLKTATAGNNTELAGTGTIVFSSGVAGTSNQLTFAGSTNTIDSGITIDGQHGYISANGGGEIITNNGIIDGNVADGSNGGIEIRDLGSTGSSGNTGTIEATAGGSAGVGESNTDFINTGTLKADGSGSTLTIGTGGEDQGTWTSPTGTITLTNNATLNLGGTFTQNDLANFSRDGTANTVNLTGTVSGNLTLNNTLGTWNFKGALYNGTFSIANGSSAQLIATNTAGILDDETVNSPINISTKFGGQPPQLTVVDNLVLNTTLNLGSADNSVFATLNFANTGVQSLFTQSVTTTSSGTIIVGGASNQMDSLNTSLTFGSGITIEGQNVSISTNGTIINDGQILANATTPGTISVQFGGTSTHPSSNSGTLSATGGNSLTITGGGTTAGASFTNSGPISISGGGTLSINTGSNSALWSNSSTITVTGSTLDVGGSFTQAELGTLTTTSSTVILTGTISSGGLALTSSTGSWEMQNGTIDGGTIRTTGGAELIGTNSTNTLNGVTLAGTLDLTQVGNASVTIQTGMTLNGTIDVGNAAGSTYGVVSFSGASQTISGSGAIVFGDSGSSHINVTNTVTLGVTVEGEQGYFQGGGTINNTGTIEANVSGGAIDIENTTFTNNGTVEALNGATLDVEPSSVTNFSSGTLTGGTWEASGNSTLFTGTAAITTDAATIIASGATSHIYSGTSGSTNALTSLGTVSGSLTIASGYTLNLANTVTTFSNSGSVTIGSGSTLATQAASLTYTQTGGSTVVNGTLDPNTLNLQGGTLSGPGSIDANVNNSGGTVYPSGVGGLGGTLSITGTYTQTSGGTLVIDVGGTTSGNFDVLAVSGTVTLAGTLDVNLVNGFALSGSTAALTPLTFAAPRTGIFGTLTSQASNGFSLAPNYVAATTSMALQVEQAGTTIFWVGGNADYNTPADWSTGADPLTTDTADIVSGKTVAFGSDTSQVTGLYVNGTLNVNGGTLTVGTTSASNFTLTTGGTLGGTGTIFNTTSAADSWSGGTINSAVSLDQSGSGSITITSTTVDALGALTVTGGTLKFGAGVTLPTLGAVTVGSNGACFLTFSTGAAVTMSSLSVSGGSAGPGTLNGSDNITVTGATNWTSGGASTPTISGSGNLILQGGLTFSGGSFSLSGRTLENFGTETTTSNGTSLSMTSATIINESGTIWNLKNTGAISNNGGTDTFTNQGTFNASVAGTTNTIGVTFNTGGPVNVNSGTLSLTGGGSSTGASFSVSSGATLGFDSSYSIDAASTVSGAGTGEFGAGTFSRTAGSVYDVTGGLTGNGGSANFGSGDTVGGTINLQNGSGTFNFNSGLTLTSLGSITVGSGNTLNFNSGLSLPSLGTVNAGTNGNSVTNFSTGSAVTIATLNVTAPQPAPAS